MERGVEAEEDELSWKTALMTTTGKTSLMVEKMKVKLELRGGKAKGVGRWRVEKKKKKWW